MADVVQIIKYEGDNKTLVWKHPIEDFNTGTQLIVHESQRAIFFMNGQALDEFPAGRYTLETQNIPKIRKLFTNISNDVTAFHCEVYFINMTEQMGIKWGLSEKINYLDPNNNFYPFKIGCRGELSIKVIEPRRLLLKLVGTISELSQEDFIDNFKSKIIMKINSYLPALLEEKSAPIFAVGKFTDEFSKKIHLALIKDFEDYGITISQFWIEELVMPEEDSTYRKLRELTAGELTIVREEKLQQQRDIIHQDTEQRKKILDVEAEAYRYKTLGMTVQEELAYGVAKAAAENEGTGGLSSVGAGIGMMGTMAYGVGNTVASIASNALDPIKTSFGSGCTTNMCNNGEDIPDILQPVDEEKGNSWSSIQQEKTDFEQRIDKLNLLREKKMISDEEFELKRREILSEI